MLYTLWSFLVKNAFLEHKGWIVKVGSAQLLCILLPIQQQAAAVHEVGNSLLLEKLPLCFSPSLGSSTTLRLSAGCLCLVLEGLLIGAGVKEKCSAGRGGTWWELGAWREALCGTGAEQGLVSDCFLLACFLFCFALLWGFFGFF